MKKSTTAAGWIARVCCIAGIIFISLFALDAFEQGTLLDKLAAFGLHMIPSFILISVLLIAWKYELIGGILFMMIAVATAPFVYQINFEHTHSIPFCLQILCMINLPFLIIGVLFSYSYYLLNKRKVHVQ